MSSLLQWCKEWSFFLSLMVTAVVCFVYACYLERHDPQPLPSQAGVRAAADNMEIAEIEGTRRIKDE
jgi:hypothetical protein